MIFTAGYRINRISEDIKREIAAITRELKDPRIRGTLTIVNVETNSDASSVKAYVSALEGAAAAELAVKGLKNATGYIRGEIGKRLGLRKAPELKFIADDSVERGAAVARLLKELSSENED